MPRWARKEWVILHELAHVIHWRQHGGRYEAGHGWQFCDIYLQLIRYQLGPDAHAALRDAFKANRVKYTKPRKRRQLTEAQRQELRERMQRINAERAAAVA